MFNSIKHTKISEDIANQIKRLIVDGKLKPGDQLPPERELIKQLGVSRPSLREALNSLVTMGFLEIRQAKRTFVKSVASKLIEDPLALLIKADTQKIFDLIEVRKAIETWAAYHAAQKASREDIEQLDTIIREMKRAFEEGRSWEKEDADFHLAIAKATHNTIHMHIMSGIYDLLRESMSKIFISRDQVKKLMNHHQQIFNAIKGRSPEKARQKTLDHLNYVESEVKKSTG
ncbi:MAG: FadR family transcriptional regulator [Deltaproteobacteria bacterium]|jgi:GntR family transcriptional repressor for pyruvate dehydrogenase complex|nr:FadR family transcriptional regulator [Deltaproteobacteria bacterium]